ncbi:MAG: hypothetical protein M1586_02060 [Patescibacteria group bacterium]|nr:hypothetical protein [Patescibacteria group bacterium]MCL5262065.1 hypothetical protein [Patescibacteria group bacterium]
MDYQDAGSTFPTPSGKPPVWPRVLLILILIVAFAAAVWVAMNYGWFGRLSVKDRGVVTGLVSNYYADYAGRVDTNDAWQAFIDRYVSGAAKQDLITEANAFLADSAQAKQRYFDSIDVLKTQITDGRSDKAVVFAATRVKSRILGFPAETKIDRTMFYLRKFGNQWLIAKIEPYSHEVKMSVDYFSRFDGVPVSAELEKNAWEFGSEEPADVYEAGAVIMRLTGNQNLIDQSLADDYRKNVESFFSSKKTGLSGQALTSELLNRMAVAAGVRLSFNIAIDAKRTNREINRGELAFFAVTATEGEKRPNPAPLRNVVCDNKSLNAFPIRTGDAQAWVEVDYPNGGESFAPGDNMTVNWRSSGTKPDSKDKSIRISLIKGSEVVNSLVTENDGTEVVVLRPERSVGSDYKISVSYTYDYLGCCDDSCLNDCHFQGLVTDQSDNNFCLVSPFAKGNP